MSTASVSKLLQVGHFNSDGTFFTLASFPFVLESSLQSQSARLKNLFWIIKNGRFLPRSPATKHLLHFPLHSVSLYSLLMDGFKSCDNTAMLLHKTIANLAHVLYNNRVKFPKDLFLFISVHQHDFR